MKQTEILAHAGTSCSHELHESKFPFVSRIDFIRSKLRFFEKFFETSFRIYLLMYPGSPTGRPVPAAAGRSAVPAPLAGQREGTASRLAAGRLLPTDGARRRRPLPARRPGQGHGRPAAGLHQVSGAVRLQGGGITGQWRSQPQEVGGQQTDHRCL